MAKIPIPGEFPEAAIIPSLDPDPGPAQFAPTDRFSFDEPPGPEQRSSWQTYLISNHGLTPIVIADMLLDGTTRGEKVVFSPFSSDVHEPFVSMAVVAELREGDYIYVAGNTAFLRPNPARSDSGGLSDRHLRLDYVEVTQPYQGQGISARFLLNVLRLSAAAGIDQIGVKAMMDAGPYAWATYGFVPRRQDWLECVAKIRAKLAQLSPGLPVRTVERISKVLDASDPVGIRDIVAERRPVESVSLLKIAREVPLGVALLADAGLTWYGRLDLTDGVSAGIFEQALKRNLR